MSKRRGILVLHTGGTLGMRPSADGWAPAPGFLEQQLAEHSVFRADGMPRIVVRELEPLLDSAEMAPADWVRIGREIRGAYAEFDGFVVVHGTDTMAYTASALAFLFEGLTKTVVLTGSQVPLCRPRSDALENLVTSLILAADYDIPEVGLYFGSRLFRGCRAVKVNCSGFDAFASPNLPALAESGTQIVVHDELLRRPATQPAVPALQERLDANVGVLWLFPGITGAIVRNFLAPPLKGVVLQSFGVGNGPVNDPDFVAALAEAHERGVVLVDCTQCLRGAVEIDAYATGAGMARAGAVSGGDMTTEAALTKLMVLFGRGCTPEEVRELVQQDLRGELSETTR
ncbi:MAG: asparaginase [Thermoanaerobaculia bacterium]